MNDQIQDIQNQIESENRRHVQAIQNLKSRLEMLQNEERAKRERDKQTKAIEAGYKRSHQNGYMFAPPRYENKTIIKGLKDFLVENQV